MSEDRPRARPEQPGPCPPTLMILSTTRSSHKEVSVIELAPVSAVTLRHCSTTVVSAADV